MTPSVWNERVRALRGSFLQSWEWGIVQEQLHRRVNRCAGDGWAASLTRQKLPFRMRYLYVPRGPAYEKEEGGERRMIQGIKTCAEEFRTTDARNAIFLRIEPTHPSPQLQALLAEAGFCEVKPVQPKQTLIVDLRKSEEDLLSDMQYETRYAIRVADRRGVIVPAPSAALSERARAFEIFWKLFCITGKRHGLRSYGEAYYRNILDASEGGLFSSDIFLAYVEDRPVAAALIVSFGETATYLFAASEDGYGRYNAPTRLLWEVIRAAKAHGSAEFDFWGIDPIRWPGVTKFKRSFGGSVVTYPGTWDFVFRPAAYAAYRLGTFIRR